MTHVPADTFLVQLFRHLCFTNPNSHYLSGSCSLHLCSDCNCLGLPSQPELLQSSYAFLSVCTTFLSLLCICTEFLRPLKSSSLWSPLEHSLPALLWRWWKEMLLLGCFLDWFCMKALRAPGRCRQNGAIYWWWVHTSKTCVIPPAGGRKKENHFDEVLKDCFTFTDSTENSVQPETKIPLCIQCHYWCCFASGL